MIHRIYSTTYKTLEFHSGLNLLITQKEENADRKQTRNRAGKTSLVEIIHFLLGAGAGKDSLLRVEDLVNQSFGMVFDLGQYRTTAERSGEEKSKIGTSGNPLLEGTETITNAQWTAFLGSQMFGLGSVQGFRRKKPTFRSLISYFIRRQLSGGFTTPEKQATAQQTGDYQINLMYLLGLDWGIASDWQNVRDQEKSLEQLQKTAKTGAYKTLVGKASDLRTELAVAENRLSHLRSQIEDFRVLTEYKDLEEEADQLTRELNKLANDNTIDAALIRELGSALEEEAPPPLVDVESIYSEAGIVLPEAVVRRYDEVRSFHQSIIRNRKDYLDGELFAARVRVESRNKKKTELDQRRAEIMRILESHGALEQFTELQIETGRLGAEVESLRQRFKAAEQLESTKNELEIERNNLTLRLRRDFSEQENRLNEAILAFEETSKKLYESAGSITVDDTSNGPMFRFPIQGSRSKGINNMQIFCFDMMLMKLCSRRDTGPGFLVHDSHIFDGVDGRQVVSALKIGAETAEELGFQYIVTMNEDDAFKETIEGFDLQKYVLPVVLTDATDDGGLFGIRF
jgi:uncharacterized protein YydD (DUF2326 family)